MRRTPWSLVGLLVVAGAVAAFHVGKAPPSVPSLRAELGASLRQAGWLISTVSLITAVGGMAIALTAERFGHRRLVLLGTALGFLASLAGAFAPNVDLLMIGRVVEGLGFIMVAVAIPTLVVRLAAPPDQRIVLTLWSAYMPAGAGSMMLLCALVLSEASWRIAWLVAAAASFLVLVALLWRALPRRELDPVPAARREILAEMIEVATSGGPLAIAFCFGAYACCWFAIVGFLPTLKSRSWAEIAASGSFCVNILGADQGELCWRFAKETEGRYDGLDWRKAPSGSPILPGVISWID